MIADFLINLILLPLRLILVPIDYLLSQIPSLSVIPETLGVVFDYVENIPTTLLYLTGGSATLWNLMFTIFLLYFTLIPSINGIKKVWAWIRP